MRSVPHGVSPAAALVTGFTAAQAQTLRHALGLPATCTDADVFIDALAEVLAEHAEEKVGGVVVPASELDRLEELAAQREPAETALAHHDSQHYRDRRDQVLAAAMSEGRIRAESLAGWQCAWAGDARATESTIEQIPPHTFSHLNTPVATADSTTSTARSVVAALRSSDLYKNWSLQ